MSSYSILIGFGLLVLGVALLSIPAACITAGAILFADGVATHLRGPREK